MGSKYIYCDAKVLLPRKPERCPLVLQPAEQPILNLRGGCNTSYIVIIVSSGEKNRGEN